jgi:hypothetical protein
VPCKTLFNERFAGGLVRLAVRCALLLAIFGVVSTEAASQRPIFGRPRHHPEKGFTVFVGSADKGVPVARGLAFQGNVLLVFPESSMTVNADKLTWEESKDGTIAMEGNVQITLDTDVTPILEKVLNGQ